MFPEGKTTMILNILEILRKYSDETHPLKQSDILAYLKKDYGMTVERKSVRRNIRELIDCGYPITYTKIPRMIPNRKTGQPEECTIWNDFYLERDFTTSELRLLIDSVLFSKYISYGQCKGLVRKLEGLSSVHFSYHTKYIRAMPENSPANPEIFYTVDILDEAISQNKTVSFEYCAYDFDKKLHPKKNSDGSIKQYIVTPYQMAVTNGRYYLLCNTVPHSDLGAYRLDRIKNIRLSDVPAKPLCTIPGCEHGIDLPKHMAEHIYMFTGKSEQVTFRVSRELLNDVIDWFGDDIMLIDTSDGFAIASVQVNLKAMRLWAMQYGRFVTIVSPRSLAEQVQNDLRQALGQYEQE